MLKNNTMEDTSTAKKLALKNANNKFNCNAFIDLNFAPPTDKILTEKRLGTIYLVQDGSDSFFVKLVDYAVFQFHQTPTPLTIAATGQEEADWTKDWLAIHPTTTRQTLMASYCYQRLK